MRRLLLAFSFAIVGHGADTVAQPPTFAGSDHPTAAGARALVAADFDRNGWPDLAHANIGRNSVSVLLGSATTGMTRRAEIAVGAGPFDLTTGDFNRDGIPDLAVANADGNSISILLGAGNGSFSRTDIMTPSHQPRGITTGDVNNDGKPDLVYAGYLTGVVQVLAGDGAGGFTAGARPAAPAARPQGVATGDFNHDGILDVAVAHATATGLRILYGSRDGTFAAHAVSGHGYLNVLGVADLDADGWIDIAAASTSASTVGVYRGGPTGLVHTGTYATGLSPRGLSIADVNGDGALDLVTANRGSRTITILLGDPAHPGAFLPALHVPAGAGSRAVAAADFDNDGRVDIAVGNEYAASATLLLNTTPFARAAYSFGEMTLPAGGMPFTHHPLVTADFNRDGRLDVASPGTSGVLVMLTGYPSLSLTGPRPFSQFFATDVEGDGDADVVYVAADSANLGGGIHTRVVTFLNDGSGSPHLRRRSRRCGCGAALPAT